MTLRDKIAAVLLASIPEVDYGDWDEIDEEYKEGTRRTVDAILATMAEHLRAVTSEMHWAGDKAAGEAGREERKAIAEIRARTGGVPAFLTAAPVAAYLAMLEVALKEDQQS